MDMEDEAITRMDVRLNTMALALESDLAVASAGRYTGLMQSLRHAHDAVAHVREHTEALLTNSRRAGMPAEPAGDGPRLAGETAKPKEN
jgi:hypothetical protein